MSGVESTADVTDELEVFMEIGVEVVKLVVEGVVLITVVLE